MKKQKAKRPPTTRKQRRSTYDSPWKTSVEWRFLHFRDFFFSDIYSRLIGAAATNFSPWNWRNSVRASKARRKRNRAYHRGNTCQK